MCSGHYNDKKLLHLIGSGAVVILGILSALGSGGNGASNDTVATPIGSTPTSITAFNFNVTDSVPAAQLAASVVSFFPNFATLGERILSTLATSDPVNSPFDLAMCTNGGRSILKWIDGDHSGNASIGDSATLQFDNCDIDSSGTNTMGTVKIGLTNVNFYPLPNNFDLNASVNISVSDGTDSTAIVANFNETTTTKNDIDFTNTYKVNDSPEQVLRVSKNGSQFEFACFNVTQTFSTAVGMESYALSPSGVIFSSDSILSLASGAQLSFINNRMESGTQRLLSTAVPYCAAIGVPNGVDNSDGSYMDIEALGGGNIRLHVFDNQNNEFDATNTTWDALLN